MTRCHRQLSKDPYPSIVLLTLALILNPYFGNCQQQPPSLNDPFPANPGQETTLPPFTGCPAECSVRWNQAMITIGQLEQKIQELNSTVLSSMSSGSGGGGGTDPYLSSRVSSVENYLYQNVTTTTNKLSNDLASSSIDLRAEISNTRAYIDQRLDSLSSSGGSGSGFPVYQNITMRLDDLEFQKVRLLQEENDVWRRNFEVVNKTFSKMRKSSYSNDVIVVG